MWSRYTHGHFKASVGCRHRRGRVHDILPHGMQRLIQFLDYQVPFSLRSQNSFQAAGMSHPLSFRANGVLSSASDIMTPVKGSCFPRCPGRLPSDYPYRRGLASQSPESIILSSRWHIDNIVPFLLRLCFAAGDQHTDIIPDESVVICVSSLVPRLQ